MNKYFFNLFMFLFLSIPLTGMDNLVFQKSVEELSNTNLLEEQFYQISPIPSHDTADDQAYHLERTILLQPDFNDAYITVTEYWKISRPGNSLVFLPQNLARIPIQLPSGSQKIILPDNSFGTFQKEGDGLYFFSPALNLDPAQTIEFPLLYKLPYPDDGQILFLNTIDASSITISLPSADIRIAADGFSYDGKRSIDDTSVDIYRNAGMVKDTQFKIQLIRQNSPVTPTFQMIGFIVSLASLCLVLLVWFKNSQKMNSTS